MEKKKNEPKKVLVETIDCTPTWKGIYKIYLAVLQNPKANVEGIRSAEKELWRMAEAADNFNELRNDFKEFESECVRSFEALLKLIDQPVKAIDPNNKKVLDEIRQLIKDYNNAKADHSPDSD